MAKLPHGLGWCPDVPDKRDRKYGFIPREFPESIDLTSIDPYPEIWDQGTFSSCVSHTLSCAIEIARIKAKQPVYMPSRLFGYYNTRKMEDSVNSDPGCMIRNAIKSLAVDGSIPETAWPYEEEFLFRKPPQMAYEVASKYQSVDYQRVGQNEYNLKSALCDGFPIIFGFMVYENISDNGYIDMPSGDAMGGHAVLIVGYDQNNFLIRNSWGDRWGLHGYSWMPYGYVLDPMLSDDFWIVRLME